jgi:hypothetical protein
VTATRRGCDDRHPAVAVAAMWRRTTALLLYALTLSACASLSERECRNEDWYDIGLDDGYDGAPASEVARHREACTPYGIEPDVEQYEAGRRDGLVHYCTVQRGLELGRKGMSYGGGCPEGTDREFLRGHALGLRFYDVDQQLERIDNELRSYYVQRDTTGLDQGQYQRVQGRIRDLETERSRLEAERRDLEWELRRL